MKIRIAHITAALAGLLFNSCAIEESPAEGGSLDAVIESHQTRTNVTDEGIFTWSSGDQIWIHTTSGSVTGTLSEGEGTSKAEFSYGSYFGEMTGNAIYPYNSGHSINGDILNVILPSSYDLGSCISNTNAAMYGSDAGGTLEFNHLAGVMRFSFKNVPAGVNRFIITLDKKINGSFTADLKDDYPIIETCLTDVESEKTVTLDFEALSQTSDIKLYVPLPVGTYTDLNLSLTKGEETIWTYSKVVTNTIDRKTLKLMPSVTLGGSIGGDINNGDSTVPYQAMVNMANSNLIALQEIITALKKNDYVTEVTPITENYRKTGSMVHFLNSLAVNIYHDSGQESGISIKQDNTGTYCWILSGEWISDKEGKKVPVTDIIPRLKIEDGYWYLTMDNGETWIQTSNASVRDEGAIFHSVTHADDHVNIELSDRTIINIQTKQNPANYWAGKKFIVNGDSIVYGSGLSSVSDGFSYLVADHFGMSLTNYAIGGSVIARRASDYDECYTSLTQWESDRDAGLLNTNKKYLVNTGSGAPRIYRIYSYNGSSWKASGNASTATGRTPLSDRIRAMDTDADVIMIMAGSNDFYYNWTPFGDFEAGKYRNNLENIDPSINLLESENVELVENGAPTASGPAIDMSYTDYFTYCNIPIAGGAAVKVPYGRRGWFLDKNGKAITNKNFTKDTPDFTIISPSNAAYLTICFKYEDISPEDCAVYISAPTDERAPNETFCDGLHKLCRYLCNTYKNKDIIFLTPVKRKQPSGIGGGTWDCIYPEDTNAEGKTIKDYRDVIIEACEYYSIPYIDMYTLSGLNPHIDPGLFADTDGRSVHPNEEGHRRMASVIIGQMQSLRQ